jgi:hypothetical protein
MNIYVGDDLSDPIEDEGEGFNSANQAPHNGGSHHIFDCLCGICMHHFTLFVDTHTLNVVITNFICLNCRSQNTVVFTEINIQDLMMTTAVIEDHPTAEQEDDDALLRYIQTLSENDYVPPVSAGLSRDEILAFAHQAKSENTQNCSICYDSAVGESIVTLPCNHDFHMSCIIPWLRSNTTCPLCRRDLRSP